MLTFWLSGFLAVWLSSTCVVDFFFYFFSFCLFYLLFSPFLDRWMDAFVMLGLYVRFVGASCLYRLASLDGEGRAPPTRGWVRRWVADGGRRTAGRRCLR